MKQPDRGALLRGAAVALIVLVAVVLLARHLREPGRASGWELGRVAALPVQEGGRIKPLDTVARTTLLMISGKQHYRDTDGARRSAVEWFTELILDARGAANRPVFRIDHPDVVGLLGFHNEERKHFSLAEIAPHFAALQEQFARIPEEPRLRDPLEKALARLRDAIAVYDAAAYTVLPPPLHGSDLESYAAMLRGLAQRARVQAIPPATGEPETLWRSIGESLAETLQGAGLDPVAEAWGAASSAYQRKDTVAFAEALGRIETLYAERSGSRASKTGFERFFNQSDPFGYAMELYVLVLLVAALSWLGWSRTLARSALWLLAVAFAVHTFGLAARVYIQERPPVTNLYSSAIFVSWAAVPLCLYLERRYLNGIAAAAAAVMGFATLIIAHHLGIAGDTLEVMRAVLDSNFWLATHVPTVTIGYSATFLAGFIAAIQLLRVAVTGRSDPAAERVVGGMVYGVICFALLFSFVGTVLGGIWADQSWGRFWGWDPKENGALMIVLWNAAILHARWGKVAGTTAILQMAVAGNIITAWSWFGTNMLGVGLHSYGFMDAAFFWLLAFIASQVAIILAGFRAPRR